MVQSFKICLESKQSIFCFFFFFFFSEKELSEHQAYLNNTKMNRILIARVLSILEAASEKPKASEKVPQWRATTQQTLHCRADVG